MSIKVKEYALDPILIARNWDVCKMMLGHFGFSQARVISTFPSKWLTNFREASSEIGEVDGTRIFEYIYMLKSETLLLVSSGRDYEPEIPWKENVIRENGLNPFDGVISDTRLALENGITLDECSDPNNIVFKAEASSCFLPRDADSLGMFVSVLLSNSVGLKFVDKFFDANKPGYLEAFKIYLDIASRKKKEFVEVFAEYGKVSDAHFENGLENLVRCIPDGMEVFLYLWAPGADDPFIDHARFILGEKAGVYIDSGLAVHKTDSSKAGCLSIEERKQMWDRYNSDGDAIKLSPYSYKIISRGVTRC